MHGELAHLYDDDILKLDIPALLNRFRSKYASIFRILTPNYWRDLRTLRTAKKHYAKLGYQDALRDLRKAHEIIEKERWIADNQSEHANMFGRHYNGLDTQWDDVSDAIASVRAIIDWFGNKDVPEILQSALVSSGVSLQTIGRYHETVVDLLIELKEDIERLSEFISLSDLPFTDRFIQDANLSQIDDWLQKYLEQLTDFWQAYDAVTTCLNELRTQTVSQLVEDIQKAQQVIAFEQDIQDNSVELERSFSHLFNGLATEWDEIIAALSWTDSVVQQFAPNSLPPEFTSVVCEQPESIQSAERLLSQTVMLSQQVEDELQFLADVFSVEDISINGFSLKQAPLSSLRERLEYHLDHIGELREWIDFQRTRDECGECGLGAFISAALDSKLMAEQLVPAFYKRFYQLWLDAVYAQDATLQNFNSGHHQSLIKEFRKLDEAQLKIAQMRIQRKLAERRPQTSWVDAPSSEQNILRHEVLKKRRHKPIRKLFSEIPNLLFALKPCLLMSPLSVSQFLAPNTFEFDLVIFDEASQIRPEDAVGTIMRGKQVIVVGDSKQLPPSSFFESIGIDGFDGEVDLENILDECSTIGLTAKPLLWHYRSRHESLIAFSNYHFYDNRLNTFPSSHLDEDELGIEFVYVSDGIYDRGKSRRNVVEARRVAKIVFEHFEKSPTRSLGVVAFSEAQQMAILEEIERLRHEKPEYEYFFDEGRQEPFFVKNLENVQGDERDVMFFSVGYGKDYTGKMSMNFGPLNPEGGERRLNVAVTRARYHVKLISSIQTTDIDLSRTRSKGVELLCNYMEYAQRGVQALFAQAHPIFDTEFESPFEASVWKALSEHGLTVHKQVGCSDYRIDLAVVDAGSPGRYVLGIECDGATYHSAKTARDRDRLRQQVLEDLGWRIHRVWSRDWIENPKGELFKILDAVQEAPQTAVTPTVESDKRIELFTEEEAFEPRDCDVDVETYTAKQIQEHQSSKLLPPGVVVYKTTPISYKGSPEDFYRIPHSQIAEVLIRIVEYEGPIHLATAAQRIVAFWGMSRTGARIKAIVDAAVRFASSHGNIKRQNHFLWPAKIQKTPVRVPPPGGKPRDIDEIATEEIAEAAYLCIQNAFSLTFNDLVSQTARLLGYNRTGQRSKVQIELGIKQLMQEDRVEFNDGTVTLVTLSL